MNPYEGLLGCGAGYMFETLIEFGFAATWTQTHSCLKSIGPNGYPMYLSATTEHWLWTFEVMVPEPGDVFSPDKVVLDNRNLNPAQYNRLLDLVTEKLGDYPHLKPDLELIFGISKPLVQFRPLKGYT